MSLRFSVSFFGVARSLQLTLANVRMIRTCIRCVRAMVSRICPTEPEMKDYIARLGKHQNPQPAKAAKPGKT